MDRSAYASRSLAPISAFLTTFAGCRSDIVRLETTGQGQAVHFQAVLKFLISLQVDQLGMVGVNGGKFPAIRQHLADNIGAVYKDMDLSYAYHLLLCSMSAILNLLQIRRVP